MAQTVKKFSINTNGHDYFCTDIHGCKTKLFKLLSAIQFDFEKDRLFRKKKRRSDNEDY